MWQSAWNYLKDDHGTEKKGWLCRRIYPESEGLDIYAAKRNPDDNKGLLIETHSAAIPKIMDYPQFAGFELYPEALKPGPNGKVRLCLVLKEEQYADIFGTLVDDVAKTTVEKDSPSQAIRTFMARLHAWRQFLGRLAQALTPNAQQGLFGELIFLSEMILPHLAVNDGVKAWVGPEGAPRDFALGRDEVEVKTVKLGKRNFSVSNLEQLNDPGDLRIILCIYHHENTGSVTLPDLVKKLRGRIQKEDPSALDLFENKILKAGYHDIHENVYTSNHQLSKTSLFLVKENFPRLIRTDIPQGVQEARYDVDLLACEPFRLETINIKEFIRWS